MSNTPFDDPLEQTNTSEDSLSAEDWAVIHAFDALDSWGPPPSDDAQAGEAGQSTPAEAYTSSDEMLITFATEVEEEIETMHRVLQHIEHVGISETAQLLPLERAGHKLRGAAGSLDYRVMATLAGHIEDLSKKVLNGQAATLVVIPVLLQAVMALQTSLVQLIETGQEHNASLQDLEEEIQRRSLDVLDADEDAPFHPVYIDARPSETQPLVSDAFFLRVDIRRIEELVRHSEQLAELQTPLESAQAKTEAAMQELQRSQQRLQHIESQFTTLLVPPHTLSSAAHALSDSSLIARILNETTPGTTSSHPSHSSHNTYTRKNKLTTKGDQTHTQPQWDELEMEQYTERDELLRAFNEAVADVTIATNNVHIAYTQLSTLLQTYKGQIAITRNDIQFLHSAPLRVLLPRLQRAIDMSVAGQEQRIHFEVIGEATEVDQHILEVLSIPLLQLLRTCISNLVVDQPADEEQTPYRVRLHAQSIGNELLLEMGFSMMVQGGIIDTIREPIERLNGSISLQRNDMAGVSFHLRLPRSQGAVRCLLVRVDDQQLLIPFSQIQRIEDAQQVPIDRRYALSALLNEPHPDTPAAALSSEQHSNMASSASIQPMIIPLQELSRRSMGITVDEVLDECEVMVKPLAPHLQRPGILGSAIDGTGNILLLLDLSTLISQYTTRQRSQTQRERPQQAQTPLRTPSILIADDSTSIRQSLQHMLRQKNYTLYEARDGMEALEQLTARIPDIFLLDMEMPNLNGYDLLNIMRLYPELADVKVIILTSRSSQKHRQRALGMGAQAYLTKPCPQDILLETIARLLDQ